MKRKNWQEHFALEQQIEQVARHTGIAPDRAATLARSLACRPPPRSTVLRVLEQINHSPTCTGCPTCDVEMRVALSAFSSGDYETYCEWLKKQRLRTAGAQGELRTNIHLSEDAMSNDYTPPEPYKKGIEKLRRELAKHTPPPRREMPLDKNGIPDGYAEGLRKLREENQ